ncbi:MAG TPA: 4'-phosphopantetheinyl transferase superfamily protein [Kofleriaceae bacterium]|nr:4'-phosphopantetheinyl transferase superfamily protein [Kofleriaceae bacterium]
MTSAAAAWSPPPTRLALGEGEVHVWRVSLAPPPARLATLARTLRDDERERAARFYFERDRTAYTATRGALRVLAGAYLGRPPEAIELGYQAKGKPYLAAPPGERLRFNVSHSGELALLAFVRGRELGVDIERRREMQDLRSLAKTSFSPLEYEALCRLPVHDHVAAFFACWSRKEAFIKATGEGVSQLADFDVSVRADEPARLLRVPGPPPSHARWSILDLPAIPGYAAALVVEGDGVGLACWDASSAGGGDLVG